MTKYRLDKSIGLLAFGVCLVGAAVAAFATFAAAQFDGFWDVLAVLLGISAVLAVGVGLVFWVRPPVVVRLDEVGFSSRVRTKHGAFAGSWLDVSNVSAEGDTLQLTLADSDAVTLPLSLVRARQLELLREVHDRLNTANGYQRFTP